MSSSINVNNKRYEHANYSFYHIKYNNTLYGKIRTMISSDTYLSITKLVIESRRILYISVYLCC